MALISDGRSVASSRADITSSSLNITAASPHKLPMVKGDLLDHAKMIVVVDTNYFLSNLSLIRSLSALALSSGLVIVVPKVVVQELDGLKLSTRTNAAAGQGSKDVSSMARAATRFLEESLGYEGNALRCQKRSEYLEKELINDDQIIDCCLYFIERHKLPVAVLSQDRSLNVKARANGCATCGEWAKDAASLIGAIANALLGSNARPSAPSHASSAASMPVVVSVGNDLQMRAIVSDKNRLIARSKLRRPPDASSLIHNKFSNADSSARFSGEVIDVSDDDKDKDNDEYDLSMQKRKKALAESGAAKKATRPAMQSCSTKSTTAAKVRRKLQEARRRSFLNSHSAVQSPLKSPSSSIHLPVNGQSIGQSDNGLAFGHFRSEFTFNVPSHPSHTTFQGNLYASNNHDISAQSAHLQSPIVIQDSDDDDMEVDSDFYQEPEADARCKKPLSTTNIGNMPLQAEPAQTKLDLPPRMPLLPQTDAKVDSDKPVVIYLDDSPRKDRELPRTAIEVSSEIVVFIRDNVRCGLTKVLCDQLKKKLPLSYAEDWKDMLKRRFALPPWNSATTVLTVIICYWDLINQAFHRRDYENIRRALPWVMKLEGVSTCPQTAAPLPLDLQFEQLALSLSNKSKSCIQRQREETAQLIALANSLLSQCALVENEAQEKIRHYHYNRWSSWLKKNTI
ncbi:hypothetical protein LPJ64_000439 [Coemansia asiatica]|uniref:PIN domain-containing protein n=1 Tax=Coemansia asiatica TaxID=1052880 RepID=A0A9W8CKX3_9FUNG|nr:hypothetical protein LPJ64_000439 [Coemansia asiatica]